MSDHAANDQVPTRPWNVFSVISNQIADSPSFEKLGGRPYLEKTSAKIVELMTDKAAIARLSEGLKRLESHFGPGEGSFMFASLNNCLTPDYHPYNPHHQAAVKPVVRKNEIGRRGLIGFPGYEADPREFHDKLASWIPERGEQQNIKQVIAEALGAKDWQELSLAHENQRANHRVKEALDFGDNWLGFAVDRNRKQPGPDSEKNIAVYSRMREIHAVARDVFTDLFAAGAIPTDTAKRIGADIFQGRSELKQPTAEEWAGDWAPPATANIQALGDAVEQMPITAATVNAKARMEWAGKAWEAAKELRPGEPNNLLTILPRPDAGDARRAATISHVA